MYLKGKYGDNKTEERSFIKEEKEETLIFDRNCQYEPVVIAADRRVHNPVLRGKLRITMQFFMEKTNKRQKE